jgi:HTH-type transcriptional regulator / antitoxin HigA
MAKGPKRYAFKPDFAVAPGATLQETIDALGMEQKELATRTGMAPKTINQIIKGKAPISFETAQKLELVTGVPAKIWNSLESKYREQLAQLAAEEALSTEENLAFLKKVPVAALRKRGLIPPRGGKAQQLQAVLRFFGVSTVEAWEDLWLRPSAAFRKSACFEASPGAVAAWLRIGELHARELRCEPYSQSAFERAVMDARALTFEQLDAFLPRLVGMCSGAGVALMMVKGFPKCPVSGATRWLTKSTALIQLTLRYKTNDQFWFSFFHEAAHILFDKRGVRIHDGKVDSASERRADAFAADTLIPAADYQAFAGRGGRYSFARIRAFAAAVGVHPGIVVGRLQRDKRLKYSHCNGLKERLDWGEQ